MFRRFFKNLGGLARNVWVSELEGLEQCFGDVSGIWGISRTMFGCLNSRDLNSVQEIFQGFEVIFGRDLSSNVCVFELEGLEQCSAGFSRIGEDFWEGFLA